MLPSIEINKHHHEALCKRIDGLPMSRIISEKEAIEFMNDKSNSKEGREIIKDLLNRYRHAKLKYENLNPIMVIYENGKTVLWGD